VRVQLRRPAFRHALADPRVRYLPFCELDATARRWRVSGRVSRRWRQWRAASTDPLDAGGRARGSRGQAPGEHAPQTARRAPAR
jgi:hypothetical protein